MQSYQKRDTAVKQERDQTTREPELTLTLQLFQNINR